MSRRWRGWHGAGSTRRRGHCHGVDAEEMATPCLLARGEDDHDGFPIPSGFRTQDQGRRVRGVDGTAPWRAAEHLLWQGDEEAGAR